MYLVWNPIMWVIFFDDTGPFVLIAVRSLVAQWTIPKASLRVKLYSHSVCKTVRQDGQNSSATHSWQLRMGVAWYTFISDHSVLVLLWQEVRDFQKHGGYFSLSHIDNAVQVSVASSYPFSDSLTTTITAQKAFTYHVRIPSWITAGTMSINGGHSESVKADSNGLQSINIPAGKTTILLSLPAEITTGKLNFKNIVLNKMKLFQRAGPIILSQCIGGLCIMLLTFHAIQQCLLRAPSVICKLHGMDTDAF